MKACQILLLLVAVGVIAGCESSQSPVAPTPLTSVEPPSTPSRKNLFNGTFWGQLIYNAYDNPGDLSGRSSLVLQTHSPSVHIRTARLPTSAVASMRQAIPGIVEAVTGTPYAGYVHASISDVTRSGWITIRVVPPGGGPDWIQGAWCGAAYVGANPGSIWLKDTPECTTDSFRALLLAHELGHALGLYHVPDDDAVMNQFNRTKTFSAAERFHGAVAYDAGRGATHCGNPASCRSFLRQPMYSKGFHQILD